MIIAKRSLERLGYYERPEWGLNTLTDDGLFEGIKRFQQDNGLTVDGVMKPGGETEKTLTPLLDNLQSAEASEHATDEEAANRDRRFGRARDVCEEKLKQDYLQCEMAYRLVGDQAGVIYEHSAMTRYGMCLNGSPTSTLPPLTLPPFLRGKFPF